MPLPIPTASPETGIMGEMSISLSSGAVLLLLGAFHGVNPGMGWLFAVALGLQERRREAVWRALLPLGVGHALAVAAAVAVALLAGTVIPIRSLRWLVAGILVAFGISRLIRHRHPRWVGMRVGVGGLTLWSFLMASAHGAGLMVVPVFLSMTVVASQPACHTFSTSAPMTALSATLIHAIGYLLVTAIVSVIVFEKLGVRILRRAWFNLDLIWAATLSTTGLITVLL
jgi:hypothetical protein